MCIFTSDTVVKNTRILVAPLGGGMQLTVYQNEAAVAGAAQPRLQPQPPRYYGSNPVVAMGGGPPPPVATMAGGPLPPGWGSGGGSPAFGVYTEPPGSGSGSGGAGPRPAMILPVPTAHGIPKLVDLSSYGGDFFKQLNEYFPAPHHGGWGSGGGFGGLAFSSKTLEVFSVGGYKCSIAANIDQLKNVDPNFFVLPTDIEKLLSQHYAAADGFAFVVCMFDHSVGKQAHPIAYVGSRCKDGSLFIPTRHEHGVEKTAARHPAAYGIPRPVMRQAQPAASLALHQGINCDQCKMTNFPGTRWKCATCPDYDVCDNCHSNPFRVSTTTHTVDHLYLEVRRPVDSAASNASGAFAARPPPTYVKDSQQQPGASFAEYDHEIFIYNGIIVGVAGVDYDRDGSRVADRGILREDFVKWDYFRAAHQLELAPLYHLERITIKGERENKDYYARAQ